MNGFGDNAGQQARGIVVDAVAGVGRGDVAAVAGHGGQVGLQVKPDGVPPLALRRVAGASGDDGEGCVSEGAGLAAQGRGPTHQAQDLLHRGTPDAAGQNQGDVRVDVVLRDLPLCVPTRGAPTENSAQPVSPSIRDCRRAARTQYPAALLDHSTVPIRAS